MLVRYEDVEHFIENRLSEIAEARIEEARRLGTETEARAVHRVERFLAEYRERFGVVPGVCPPYIHLQSVVTQIALGYEGVSERGTTNTGYLVDKWHRELGLNPGLPWCVMFGQHVYKRASLFFGMPDILPINTASTQKLADEAEVLGLATIDITRATPGSGIIFRDGKHYRGHFEILMKTDPRTYDSVGGNTNSEFSRDGGDVGLHSNRGWNVYGPVGTMKSTERRWTRCIIPLPALYEKYWKPINGGNAHDI